MHGPMDMAGTDHPISGPRCTWTSPHADAFRAGDPGAGPLPRSRLPAIGSESKRGIRFLASSLPASPIPVKSRPAAPAICRNSASPIRSSGRAARRRRPPRSTTGGRERASQNQTRAHAARRIHAGARETGRGDAAAQSLTPRVGSPYRAPSRAASDCVPNGTNNINILCTQNTRKFVVHYKSGPENRVHHKTFLSIYNPEIQCICMD